MKSCSEQGFRVVEDKYDSLFKFSILPSTSIAQENPATTNCLQLMYQQNLRKDFHTIFAIRSFKTCTIQVY